MMRRKRTSLKDCFGPVVQLHFVALHESLLAFCLLRLKFLHLLLQLAHGHQLDQLPDAGQEDEGGHAHQEGEEHHRQDVLHLHLGVSHQTSLSTLPEMFGGNQWFLKKLPSAQRLACRNF